MRIAYLVHWNDGAGSGVMKKIISHVRAWREGGCEVALFLLRSGDADPVPDAGDIPLVVRLYGRRTGRIRSTALLARDVSEWNPDVIYRRYDIHYPALTRLARAVPTVLEINSNDLMEYRTGSALRDRYNRLTRARVLRSAGGLVFVTHELSRLPQFASFGRPFAVIGNGITLDAVQRAAAPRNDRPRLVFLGTPGQTWHGVDGVLRLAQRFPDWVIDLIGISVRDVADPLPANVTAHGFLDAHRYFPILSAADVAIGSLALHRIGINEASPLKVREYLASGLPTIIGYRDTDFDRPRKFLLELPNTADSIDKSLDAIEAFVTEWQGRRVPREEVLHLDTRVKENRRIAFLRSVARRAAG
jgi:hypothetical protein